MIQHNLSVQPQLSLVPHHHYVLGVMLYLWPFKLRLLLGVSRRLHCQFLCVGSWWVFGWILLLCFKKFHFIKYFKSEMSIEQTWDMHQKPGSVHFFITWMCVRVCVCVCEWVCVCVCACASEFLTKRIGMVAWYTLFVWLAVKCANFTPPSIGFIQGHFLYIIYTHQKSDLIWCSPII